MRAHRNQKNCTWVSWVTEAEADVLREREGQVTAHRHTPEKDNTYRTGDLAMAGLWYALPQNMREWFVEHGVSFWPWSEISFKPRDRRKDLVKAAALLLAEIERIDATEGENA
jgi:hypothetical protein